MVMKKHTGLNRLTALALSFAMLLSLTVFPAAADDDRDTELRKKLERHFAAKTYANHTGSMDAVIASTLTDSDGIAAKRAAAAAGSTGFRSISASYNPSSVGSQTGKDTYILEVDMGGGVQDLGCTRDIYMAACLYFTDGRNNLCITPAFDYSYYARRFSGRSAALTDYETDCMAVQVERGLTPVGVSFGRCGNDRNYAFYPYEFRIIRADSLGSVRGNFISTHLDSQRYREYSGTLLGVNSEPCAQLEQNEFCSNPSSGEICGFWQFSDPGGRDRHYGWQEHILEIVTTEDGFPSTENAETDAVISVDYTDSRGYYRSSRVSLNEAFSGLFCTPQYDAYRMELINRMGNPDFGFGPDWDDDGIRWFAGLQALPKHDRNAFLTSEGTGYPQYQTGYDMMQYISRQVYFPGFFTWDTIHPSAPDDLMRRRGFSCESVNGTDAYAAMRGLTNIGFSWVSGTVSGEPRPLGPNTVTQIPIRLPSCGFTINRITINTSGSEASAGIQGLRIIRPSVTMGAGNNWNRLSDEPRYIGTLSRQPYMGLEGCVIAETDSRYSCSVTNGNGHTYYGNDSTKNGSYALNCYGTASEPGSGSGSAHLVNTRWSGKNTIGVEVCLGPATDAGLDFLLFSSDPDKIESRALPLPRFLQGSPVNGGAGLRHILKDVQEFATLHIEYLDSRGFTRKLDVPYYALYMFNLFADLKGDVREIVGPFQPGSSMAVRVPLDDCAKFVSASLIYGRSPAGFDWRYHDISSEKDPTATDHLGITGMWVYESDGLEDVTASSFRNTYQHPAEEKKATHVPQVKTDLVASCSKISFTFKGEYLSKGGSFTVSGDRNKGAQPKAQAPTPEDLYLFEFTTASGAAAGLQSTTECPVYFTVHYTNRAGAQCETKEQSLMDLSLEFYGRGSSDRSAEDQYIRHMVSGRTIRSLVQLPGAASVDSIDIRIDKGGRAELDDLQMSLLSVSKVVKMDPLRYCKIEEGASLFWDRLIESKVIAEVKKQLYFYERRPDKSIVFTKYDEEGKPILPDKKQDDSEYLNGPVKELTYEDTLKDLGFAQPRYDYQVDVHVANVNDAGSTNYFFFQLVFEGGTSGVVLANQQLSSDAFNMGAVESFHIRTSQNYGKVKAVRVICDNKDSSSNVFDKLNIEKIVVTTPGLSGINTSWSADRIGWIDISYEDEGSAYGSEGSSRGADTEAKNSVLIKEFPITAVETSVNIQFCMTYAEDSIDHLTEDEKKAIYATLFYRDDVYRECQKEFNLYDALQQYNDNESTQMMMRPGHIDRFCLLVNNITSLSSIQFKRGPSPSLEHIHVSEISAQNITGLGDVYLSPTVFEFNRDVEAATDIAKTSSMSLPPDGIYNVTFGENTIDPEGGGGGPAWSSRLTRIPDVSTERLNIYAVAGYQTGRDKPYEFGRKDEALTAHLTYTLSYGATINQKNVELSTPGIINSPAAGVLDGRTVLYCSDPSKRLLQNSVSTLRNAALTSTSTSTEGAPYIDSVVIERVKNGCIAGLYRANFAGHYMSSSGSYALKETTDFLDCNEIIRLQVAEEQAATALTPETNDIAVGLLYTSAMDLGENKTIYRSPYIYLSDFGITAVRGGEILNLSAAVDGVDRVVGLEVVSSGPTVTFDRAAAYHHMGGDPEDNSSENLASACHIPDSFTVTTVPQELLDRDHRGSVHPAVLSFVTGSAEATAGAGTTGKVSLDIGYKDSLDIPQTFHLEDIRTRLPAGQTLSAGSEVSFDLLLPDVVTPVSMSITSQEDSWFISSASLTLTNPDLSVSSLAIGINNWARGDGPLTIDLTKASEGIIESRVTNLSVTGSAFRSGYTGVGSSASGTALTVAAVPGDTVTLTPAAEVIGSPDTTLSWSADQVREYFTASPDGSGIFNVPALASSGTAYTLAVCCSSDRRIRVDIVIRVTAPEDPADEKPPAALPPEPEDGSGDSSSGGDGSGDGGDAAP